MDWCRQAASHYPNNMGSDLCRQVVSLGHNELSPRAKSGQTEKCVGWCWNIFANQLASQDCLIQQLSIWPYHSKCRQISCHILGHTASSSHKVIDTQRNFKLDITVFVVGKVSADGLTPSGDRNLRVHWWQRFPYCRYTGLASQGLIKRSRYEF